MGEATDTLNKWFAEKKALKLAEAKEKKEVRDKLLELQNSQQPCKFQQAKATAEAQKEKAAEEKAEAQKEKATEDKGRKRSARTRSQERGHKADQRKRQKG